jgi:hypothetical protein
MRHPLADVPSFMSSDLATCQYDASPSEALAAVRTHQGPLLVDVDETLYLRNSTEDFIDCAWPGLLALLLLRVLDVLKPWRLTGGIDTRDTWRVCAISIFFPWTRWRWRAKVPFFAERYVNQALKAALKARAQPPIILTSGFKPIVASLLAAMGFADARLIAARMYSFADRRSGKLRMATCELGAETVGRCLVVTDSVNDLEVLQSCARPLRTVWPHARYREALGRVYLPGEYTSRIKRPGTRYIFGSVLQEDLAFWVLSSIGLATHPASHLVGLLLLLLSFWAIYERGYVDNDLVASRYEADPKLSATFGIVRVATPAVQPWIWAAARGRGRGRDSAPRQNRFRRAFCTLGGGADFDVRLLPVLQPARQEDPRLALPIAAIRARRRIHGDRTHRACGRRRVGRTCAVPMGAVPNLPPDFRGLAERAAGAGAPDLVRTAAVVDDRRLTQPFRPADVERIGTAGVECIQGAPRHLCGFQFRTTPRPILSPGNDPAQRTRSIVAARNGSSRHCGRLDSESISRPAAAPTNKFVKFRFVVWTCII